MPMLDWVVMNVIHMTTPIFVISNQMFPKPSLPDRTLPF